MKSIKLLTAITLSLGILVASCGTAEQKKVEETPKQDSIVTPAAPAVIHDTAAIANYNKDEAEMLDKHATLNYKSKDGTSTVKVSFLEKGDGNNYLNFQKDNGKTIELSLVTAHEGTPVYANPDAKIQWESKEGGGRGTLTENGKITDYKIINK